MERSQHKSRRSDAVDLSLVDTKYPTICNVEAEKSIIGGILSDNESINSVLHFLNPEDFKSTAHEILFGVMRDMINAGKPIDHISLKEELSRLGKIDKIGGVGYLASLDPHEFSGRNVEHWGRIVKQYSVKRQAFYIGYEIAQAATNGIDHLALLNLAHEKFDELSKKATAGDACLIVPADEFLKSEIPQREEVISNILWLSFLAMIYGFRGRGKTYFLLSMAISIATASKFLCWDVPFPRTVIYVDGEMPEDQLQKRLIDLTGGQKVGNLYLLTSHQFHKKYGRYLNLNTIADQQFFLRQIESFESSVIIFDSISTLTSGSDENLSLDQEPFIDFSRQLRHKGHCVNWSHHAGKNQDQRGASKREDILDLSINLAEPSTPAIDGAKFRLEFSKVRGKMPKPHSLECELVSNEFGVLGWVYSIPDSRTKKVDRKTTYLKWIADHQPSFQVEIAQAFGVTGSAVTQHLNVLRAEKLLDGLKVTADGQDFLKRIYGQ